MYSSSKWSPPFRFSDQNFVSIKSQRTQFEITLRQWYRLLFHFLSMNGKRWYLLVRGGTDIRLEWLATRLKLVRYSDIVSKQTVPWHLLTHYSCQHCACV
jgi:hypothetical protein